MSNSKQHDYEQTRRLRLLYSLGDFQLALSAATFSGECETDTKYSKVDLRRFRCYETTMIVAYARPYTNSRGTILSVSLKRTGAKLTEEQKELHQTLLELRNKVFAHSDEEMMRMVSKTFSIPGRDGKPMTFFQPVFDEGLTYIGHKNYRGPGTHSSYHTEHIV